MFSEGQMIVKVYLFKCKPVVEQKHWLSPVQWQELKKRKILSKETKGLEWGREREREREPTVYKPYKWDSLWGTLSSGQGGREREKEKETNAEGHHREGEAGMSSEHCGPFVTCTWVNERPSLSLVKHDARPRPSARRWLKFALRSLGEQLAEAALLLSQSKWAERSRLGNLHSHALFI